MLRIVVLESPQYTLPNGNPINTEKFDYKIEWMDQIKTITPKKLLGK